MQQLVPEQWRLKAHEVAHAVEMCIRDRGLGAKLVMMNALEDAEMDPKEVDYINVHGTSTPVSYTPLYTPEFR